MRQVRRLRINAPHRKVWDLIDDDAKLQLWMPNVAKVRYPGGKKEKRVGTRFVHEMRAGESASSYEGEVTEYEKGQLLGMLLHPEAFAIHVVYHVSGDEDWTLLEYGADVKPLTWRGYLMVWWGRRLLNSILDQQLARLRIP